MGAPTSVRKRVPAGSTERFFTFPANTTIQVGPGSGGTMTVKVRVHPDSDLVDLDPDATSFSSAATRVLLGPVYEIQFAAASADGFASIAY